MLTIYRRHIKKCAHRSEGRKYRRCRCPIWADGFIGAEEIRKSLDTRDWEKAKEIIREWEAEGTQAAEPKPITIAYAWEEFLADAKARNLQEPTVYKYDLLSRQMACFATDQGIRFLRELDLPMLRKFRATWPNQNLGALKKLEYLRAFLRFAHESKWIDENPARKLESPKVKQSPTMPFTPEQMAGILAGCEKYGMKCRGGKYQARRMPAACGPSCCYSVIAACGSAMLSRLERSRISGDKLFLYTAKTGTPVYVPLPGFVMMALEAVPKISEQYFFWPANRRGRAQRVTGNGRSREYSRKQKSPMVTPTASATLSRSGFCRLAYQWTGFRSCSDTAASRSLRSTTRHGCGLGRSNLRPTSGGPG